jgi:hypothetical protein
MAHFSSRCLVLILLASWSCAGDDKPSTPASPTPPSGGASFVRGRAVSVIDGAAEAGVSVQVGTGQSITTDSSGGFQADVSTPGKYSAMVRGATIVERETTVDAPDGNARLSLIPATFDIGAFNQLARTTNQRLQRWTIKPALIVIVPVMHYSNSVDDGFVATNDKMTDFEASSLASHLTEALALLSGGTYTAFESTILERPAAGDLVSVKRPGKIVVGRYYSMPTMDGTIGLATWFEQSDGTVNGGVVFLDEPFDHNDSRRRLLRYHELGHALGYRHVTSRTSIMNPVIGPEPTDFDREAAMIAYQRPPGNRSPDRDPDTAARIGSLAFAGAHWVKPLR